MRTQVLASCIFCTAGMMMAAQPAWDLAPTDAKILMGVDVRGLRNSSLADSMTSQMRAQMQAPMAMLHVPGIELLDDIDSVFLAATGDTPAAPKPASAKTGTATASKATPTAKTSSPFLLALSGTFPDEHLRPLLKGLHPSYKGINVYRGTGADTSSMAVLDEHTVLMGDEKSIYRAIDRKTAGMKAQGELIARARELAATNDIWVVARDASGNLQKSTGPGALVASEIEGLDLGLALRDGFNMNLNLATKTEAGATSLSQLLSSQMQAAVSTKMDTQMAEDFWKKVKVAADGKRMQVQIALSKEELQENIRMMQEQRAAQPFSPSRMHPSAAPAATPGVIPTSAPAGITGMTTAAPIASAQPASPPKPRVVKIYGLDDGVREVKLDQKN